MLVQQKRNNYREQQVNSARNQLLQVLANNKRLWLSLLCLLYILKIYNPAFAWFGAFGAIALYKDDNIILRRLSYLSILGFLGFIGLLL